jgi:hypothetical protein
MVVSQSVITNLGTPIKHRVADVLCAVSICHGTTVEMLCLTTNAEDLRVALGSWSALRDH